MERREVAESALKQLCDNMGVLYTTESHALDGAWFLDTITRGKVNIAQWSENAHTGGRGISFPLGSYGQNLTHEECYDRCWFTDRAFKVRKEQDRMPAGLKVRGVGEGLKGY